MTSGARTLTAAETQALHDAFAASRTPSPFWIVNADPARPGRVVAQAYIKTHTGGELLGILTAASLDELRAMLPAGLTRRERAAIRPPEVVETWD